MNAKQELLRHIDLINDHLGGAKILAASISYSNPRLWLDDDDYTDDKETAVGHMLKKGHTDAEYEAFINGLDFDYDSGYGIQELYGYVWFTNGIWMTRHEYDGSECWEIHKYPEIPEELHNEPLITIN